MLIISWAIALIAIMIAGMWAGRALESSRQFTGADRSYGAIGVGCMLAAVQIGGMSMIGAAQNGYNIGRPFSAVYSYGSGNRPHFVKKFFSASISRSIDHSRTSFRYAKTV